MERSELAFARSCGGRLASAAVAFVLLSCSAMAQRVIVEPPRVYTPLPPPVGTTGIGGGAGLTLPNPATTFAAPPPAVMPAPAAPALPAPAPALPVPTAQPLPAAPAPTPPTQVRFRCELAPEDQSCKEEGVHDGGDGGDSECNCDRDYCHDEAGPEPGQTRRVCDKLQ